MDCIFCKIVNQQAAASVVFEDAHTMAFIDLRQFHDGHTLVIPKRHFHDVREVDPASGAALMATLSRITSAVSQAFPNEGISIWSSIGAAAFQEVPHLHWHVHPRRHRDGFLRIYPKRPSRPGLAKREALAELLRAQLADVNATKDSAAPSPMRAG
jgi:histidine triad (HIT) family protein